MTPLRWAGLLFGLLTLLFVFNRFRYGRLRRLDFCIMAFFSVSLVGVSVFPESVGVIRDLLALEATQFSRLIAITILSNMALWVLFFYTRFRWTEQTVQFDRLVRQLGVAEFRRCYPDVAPLPQVVVVIPAYDEAENIGAVLEQMPDRVCGRPIGVLVIDDGSGDNTLDAARESGAMAVRTPMNRGGGAALRTGFDIAGELGAEIVVTMDADGQHLPSEIEGLVAPILDDTADFVIGSRLLGHREKDSVARYVGIWVFNFVIRLLTPVKITDCSNGFRAFRAAQLRRVLLLQDQFHTAELIVDAARKGVRIGEAPVTVKRRLSGMSKKGRNWSYGLNFARTILKTWWR